MLVTPTLDGSAVFGSAVKMAMEPNDLEMSYAAYFGVNGVCSIVGGGRGRIWQVVGVLGAASLAGLVVARGALLSFNDGLPHTLVDTWGVSWYPVLFTKRWRPTSPLLWLPAGAVGVSYALELESNI